MAKQVTRQTNQLLKRCLTVASYKQGMKCMMSHYRNTRCCFDKNLRFTHLRLKSFWQIQGQLLYTADMKLPRKCTKWPSTHHPIFGTHECFLRWCHTKWSEHYECNHDYQEHHHPRKVLSEISLQSRSPEILQHAFLLHKIWRTT